MKSVDPYTGLYIEEVFRKGDIVFELEVLLQFLRLENEFFLQEINQDRKYNNANDDIPDEMGQYG